jgi:hypothetical protein
LLSLNGIYLRTVFSEDGGLLGLLLSLNGGGLRIVVVSLRRFSR